MKNILTVAETEGIATHLVQQKSNDNSWTPFSAAVQNDHSKKVIKLLLQYDVDIDEKAGDKMFNASPLFMAAQNNRTDLVELLIKKGADCNAKLLGRDHATPLYASAEKGYTEIVKILLNECKELKWGNEVDDDADEYAANQHTPIHIACMNGHISTVEAFVDFGITLSVMDRRSSVSSEEQGIRHLTKAEVGPFCNNVHERTKQAQKEGKRRQKEEL